MDIRFIGIDPETPNGGSPTVWIEAESETFAIQGWRPGAELETALGEKAWVPDHTVGIPDHEYVVQIPIRMVPILRKACDEAERAGLYRADEER